ncbi:MAG: RnfABCDGE type electron transport complex subunit B [Planctomycetes bacterium]|nr:RnfABCDGE type electron transport complex subunit B [Planctomycetota bacterium]
MDLGSLLLAAAILGGVGLVFGSLIAIAHRAFWVWVDPRITAVTEMLPGTNCGACGFPGCSGFAQGLIGEKATPAGCTVMSPDQAVEVAHYLGVDVGSANRRVARLLCAGDRSVAVQRAEYRGLSTCVAAAPVATGGKACTWGCLGMGDCEAVCDFDAIIMSDARLPLVDPERCTACGDCVEVCPKDLFVLMPVTQKLIVQCRSLLEGDEAESICQVACTGCGKCALDAAPQLIEIVNGLAVVDYTHNERAAAEATARCPTGAIAWVEGAQFPKQRERTRSWIS